MVYVPGIMAGEAKFWVPLFAVALKDVSYT